MGNNTSGNGSGIKILLTNRTIDDPIYLSNEDVECTVQLVDIQQYADMKLKDAYVELVGLSLHTTSTMFTDANGSLNTMLVDEQRPFFSQRHSLLSKFQQIDVKAISSSGITDKWAFSFTIPNNLPPSLPPSLVYCVRVGLDVKTWRHKTISHSIPITVYPHLDVPKHLYQSHQSIQENRKDVQLRAIISQGVISPGTHLLVQYELHNPKKLTVDEIIITLYQHRQMGTSISSKTVVTKMEVPNVNKFQGEHLQDKLNLAIPNERLPPTLPPTSFDSVHLSEFNPVSVTYELNMEVKLSGIFTNFALSLPLTMDV